MDVVEYCNDTDDESLIYICFDYYIIKILLVSHHLLHFFLYPYLFSCIISIILSNSLSISLRLFFLKTNTILIFSNLIFQIFEIDATPIIATTKKSYSLRLETKIIFILVYSILIKL